MLNNPKKLNLDKHITGKDTLDQKNNMCGKLTNSSGFHNNHPKNLFNNRKQLVQVETWAVLEEPYSSDVQ